MTSTSRSRKVARAMRVKPSRPGLLVRDPAQFGKVYLPEEGAEVPVDSYWARALRRGDVVPAEKAAPAAPAPTPTTTKRSTKAKAKDPEK